MSKQLEIKPIPSPVAWTSEEFHARNRWIYELTDADRECLDRALRHLKGTRKGIPFGPEDFPVGEFRARIDAIREELEYGAGVLLVRGLEVDRYALDEVRQIYWGFGAHMGKGLAQTPRGSLLIDVTDTGGNILKDVRARAYHTNEKLAFHNDQGDIVGLLCYRHAKAGGQSIIACSAAVHNEILATRPDLAAALYEPFYQDVRGEEPAGRKPYYVEPRFAVYKDRFYAQHGPNYIRSAQRYPDVPRLTPAQIEGMALIDELCQQERFQVKMDFRRGDFQFLNNHNVLHSRTDYEDFDDPSQKRHLLRLWLVTPRYQDIPPFFERRYDDMAYWQQHPLAA